MAQHHETASEWFSSTTADVLDQYTSRLALEDVVQLRTRDRAVLVDIALESPHGTLVSLEVMGGKPIH